MGASARQPALTGGHRVTALCPQGMSSGGFGRHGARALDLGRVGGTTIAAQPIEVPRALGQPRHISYSRGAPSMNDSRWFCKVIAAGVGCGTARKICPRTSGGAAQSQEAHEGRQRDRVCASALERFLGVLLGGGANVAALGVRMMGHGAPRGACAPSGNARLALGRCAAKVGNLRQRRSRSAVASTMRVRSRRSCWRRPCQAWQGKRGLGSAPTEHGTVASLRVVHACR